MAALHPVVERVTARIAERSRKLRDDYLARMDAARESRPARRDLGCGNLAHGFAAAGPDKQELRSGRGGNLVLALLTFVVYYNLISLGQTWIAGGRIGMGAYLLILHGGAFALAVGWIASRHQNWSLAALWRPRSRNAAAISS